MDGTGRGGRHGRRADAGAGAGDGDAAETQQRRRGAETQTQEYRVRGRMRAPDAKPSTSKWGARTGLGWGEGVVVLLAAEAWWEGEGGFARHCLPMATAHGRPLPAGCPPPAGWVTRQLADGSRPCSAPCPAPAQASTSTSPAPGQRQASARPTPVQRWRRLPHLHTTPAPASARQPTPAHASPLEYAFQHAVVSVPAVPASPASCNLQTLRHAPFRPAPAALASPTAALSCSRQRLTCRCRTPAANRPLALHRRANTAKRCQTLPNTRPQPPPRYGLVESWA